METQTINEMIEALNLNEHIKLNDIPNLDLYMDQVITLFEERLKHTKRNEAHKLLTKTMINNYTKDKLLMPAVKKKYTKEHILLMIILYELKHILTIGDIKDLFSTIIKDDKIDAAKLSSIYQIYLNTREKSIPLFKEEVEDLKDYLAEEITEQAVNSSTLLQEDQAVQDMLLVIMLTEKANYYKRLAEKLIDERIKNKG